MTVSWIILVQVNISSEVGATKRWECSPFLASCKARQRIKGDEFNLTKMTIKKGKKLTRKLFFFSGSISTYEKGG